MMYKTIFFLALILTGLSCTKESGSAVLTVRMVDQPIDFDSVNVEIVNVQIHFSSSDTTDSIQSGWIDLATNAGLYNLLELQNGVSAVLADPNEIPVGKLQQMRFILGNNNYAVDDSTIYPLDLSSQDKTGLKVNLKADVAASDSIEIILDFDAEKSIIETGNGSYKLKPVIKVEDILYY